MTSTSAHRTAVALGAALLILGVALAPASSRRIRASESRARLERAAAILPRSCILPTLGVSEQESDLATAGWQTIGGCGAGSSTGIGGIKWIGRNVRGGLLNVQCQGNYTKLTDGYVYTLNNQVSRELSDSFSFGVIVPYLYKFINDPYELGYDVSNKGVGDINLLFSARLGAIKATTLTLSVGLPTGTWKAEDLKNQPLKQDRQLGSGKPSAGFMLDHVIDNDWGPTVIGASGSYPGTANALDNYRAPSGSVYAYAGYLLGPLVPAIGVSAIGFLGYDRDIGLANEARPLYMAAINASVEWSNDWMALLAGASVPYARIGMQPWTVGLGLALSPF